MVEESPCQTSDLNRAIIVENVDSFVNSSRAYLDCLALSKLTGLGEPKKRED